MAKLTDEGSDAASPTSEEVPDGLYDSSDEEVVDEEEWYKRENRKAMLRWIMRVDNIMDEYKTMPPMSIVLYPDLMDRAWGWGRLVIYEDCSGICGHVEWSTFMEYLKEYFHRNATSLCPMRAAAYRCLEAEKKYCTSRAGDLTDDDMILSDNIQKRASCIINLEGESFAAAAGLVCIAEEAELMSELPSSKFKTMSVVSNKIRRRALNLTRYKGSESEAVAAALLGMSKETKSVRNVMIRRNKMSLTDISVQDDMSVEEFECVFVRKGTLPLLIKLEDCFAREIAGNVDGNATPAAAKTEKPIRDSIAGELKSDKSENPIGDSPVVESKSDKSNANENSKDTNEHHGKNNHGNKKRKRNKKSKRNDSGKNNHDNVKSKKKNKKNMKRMGQTKNIDRY